MSPITKPNTNLTDAATSYIVNLAMYRENTFMRIVARRKETANTFFWQTFIIFWWDKSKFKVAVKYL